MFKKVSLTLGAAVVLLLVYVAFQPSAYHYEREISIGASPEAIFPYVSNTAHRSQNNGGIREVSLKTHG